MFSVPRLSTRFYLSLALVICLASVILTGCDSNPSGSSASATSTGTPTGTPTSSAVTTSTLYGSILDLNTGKQIPADSGAKISVTIYKDGKYVDSRAAVNNNFYSFTGIEGGIYYVEVNDGSNPKLYEKNYIVINLAANVTLEQNFSLTPVPGAIPPLSSYTVVGKLLNAVDRTPVMFANVSLGGNSFSTNTLEDGTFILYGVSEGEYTVTFSKTGFSDLQITLVASSSKVFCNLKAATDGVVVDGAGNNIAGKDIGTLVLGPSVASTGALSGVLHDPVTDNTLAAGTKVMLWYKPGSADTIQPAVIYRPTANAQGYVSIENLPPGFYAITSLDTIAVAKFDNNGDLINYTLTGTSIYTGAYYQVQSGKTTVLVSDGL